MIYSNFTGRVAKKAKLIDGVNGQFLSMDMAVNDYSKGEEVTQWVRVQSSDPAHLKLAEFFTKGRILTIQGISKIDQWEGKDGTPHAPQYRQETGRNQCSRQCRNGQQCSRCTHGHPEGEKGRPAFLIPFGGFSPTSK